MRVKGTGNRTNIFSFEQQIVLVAEREKLRVILLRLQTEKSESYPKQYHAFQDPLD